MLLFFTTQVTPRLQYVFDFLGTAIGQPIQITTDEIAFSYYQHVKIAYAEQQVSEDAYHILPHGLLFQKEIQTFLVEVGTCRGLQCLFPNSNDHHGFDVFAAIFYLLSRYEEYHTHQKDVYGRYAHTNSLAYKHAFLDKPLVNFWIQDLLSQLETKFSTFQIVSPKQFSFLPTYDIDIAYAYRHQPLVKNIGGFLKDLVKADIDKVIERATVYSGTQPDPFDSYEWLHQLHRQYCQKPIHFFLLAKKRSVYDKNLSPTSKAMRQLVKAHASQYQVGIHPSWQSGDNLRLVESEIKSLEKMSQKPCFQSRQHYIRFTMPQTFRLLVANGIKEDYSMGYGSINGFRASVASPFFWYDLENETTTELRLFPFCFMEANAHFEEQLSAEEAGKELQYYHDIVQQVNGLFITIFHNHFLTEQPQWKAWKQMYAQFLANNF